MRNKPGQSLALLAGRFNNPWIWISKLPVVGNLSGNFEKAFTPNVRRATKRKNVR